MPRSLNVRPNSARLTLISFAFVFLFGTTIALPSFGQDWESDSNQASDDWSSAEDRGYSSQPGGDEPTTPWSFRAGMGFTNDPNNFLLSFELPYRFDQYVSLGPLFQIGLGDDRYIVAPSVNLTITIPDLPGENFDRFKPNLFAGVGFAVIENEGRAGDDRAVDFLINTGFGVDYVLSQRVSIGSRMILNFLPNKVLDEKFFYTWEVASIKLAF